MIFVNKYKYFYPVVFHPEEEGGYSVWVPDLPGCCSQGEDISEAVAMIQEAMDLYLEFSFDEGQPANMPSNPKEIAVEGDEFVVMVECDLLSYQKKYNNKAIKKTLTIPAWLNEIAESRNVNFSATLQDALMKQFELK